MKVAAYFLSSDILRQLNAVASAIGDNLLIRTGQLSFIATPADEYWTDDLGVFKKYQHIDTSQFVFISGAGPQTPEAEALTAEMVRGARVTPKLTQEMIQKIQQDQKPEESAEDFGLSEEEFVLMPEETAGGEADTGVMDFAKALLAAIPDKKEADNAGGFSAEGKEEPEMASGLEELEEEAEELEDLMPDELDAGDFGDLLEDSELAQLEDAEEEELDRIEREAPKGLGRANEDGSGGLTPKKREVSLQETSTSEPPQQALDATPKPELKAKDISVPVVPEKAELNTDGDVAIEERDEPAKKGTKETEDSAETTESGARPTMAPKAIPQTDNKDSDTPQVLAPEEAKSAVPSLEKAKSLSTEPATPSTLTRPGVKAHGGAAFVAPPRPLRPSLSKDDKAAEQPASLEGKPNSEQPQEPEIDFSQLMPNASEFKSLLDDIPMEGEEPPGTDELAPTNPNATQEAAESIDASTADPGMYISSPSTEDISVLPTVVPVSREEIHLAPQVDEEALEKSKSRISSAGLNEEFEQNPGDVSLSTMAPEVDLSDTFALDIEPDEAEFMPVPSMQSSMPHLEQSVQPLTDGREIVSEESIAVEPYDYTPITPQPLPATPTQPRAVPSLSGVPGVQPRRAPRQGPMPSGRVPGQRPMPSQTSYGRSQAGSLVDIIARKNEQSLSMVGDRFAPTIKRPAPAMIPKSVGGNGLKVNRGRRNLGLCYLFGSSARKGGASTLAYNFACECSRALNSKVCLIDLDLATSELSRRIYMECGMSWQDNCGIENVLNMPAQEYISNLHIFTANIANLQGDSFYFIRSNPTYPYQIKKLLSQANFTRLVDSLKQVFDVVIIDLGNFQNLAQEKYKSDLLRSGQRTVVTFNCANKRSILESTEVCNRIPCTYDLVLTHYRISVNPIDIAKATQRRISGTLQECRALMVNGALPILSTVTQNKISEDWEQAVTNLRNM